MKEAIKSVTSSMIDGDIRVPGDINFGISMYSFYHPNEPTFK